MNTFLSNEIFKDLVLPFILVFTIVFAILEKSKLLGDGKQQINAIVGFIVAGIFVTFATQVEWLRKFSVFLAIALFIYFIFMLIYGFAYGVKEGDPFKDTKGMKSLLGGIAFVAVVVATLLITDTWNTIVEFFTEKEMGANVIILLVIVGVITAVFWGGKSKESKKE